MTTPVSTPVSSFSNHFIQIFNSVTASDTRIAKPSSGQNHLSLYLNQTSAKASSKSIFEVDHDISGAWSLEYKLLTAVSIASITGPFSYRIFTSKETMLSSGTKLMDSSFLRALSVDASMLAQVHYQRLARGIFSNDNKNFPL